MAERIDIALSEDDALILFEWLHPGKIQPGSAEWVVVQNVICQLERVLAAPFASDYATILAAARGRVQQED